MTYGNYPDLKNAKRVLVVKLRHLGDTLLTVPLFVCLKKAHPHLEIDAYVYKESKELLENQPSISSVLGYDRSQKKKGPFSRFFYEIKMWRKIRKGRYDVVINLTEGDRGAIAAKVSKAKIRVGFKPKGKWQKKLYTHIVKDCPTLRHTVERNLDALRRIGVFPSMEDRELFFPLFKSEKIKKWGKDFILIHPTSRWRFKCWSISKMRKLISSLIEKGERVVLSSGPDPQELEMIEQISEGLNVESTLGSLTLLELGALIDASKLLICVDSLPFHIASALKKPVLALFGPTSDVTWGPWRNPFAKVITEPVTCRPCYMDGCGGSKFSDCLERISVQRVIDESLGQSKSSLLLHETKAHQPCR